MRIEVKPIGTAAYIQLHGGILIEILSTRSGKVFIFESDKSYQEWQIDYSNSCCSKHDNLVCELRNMVRDLG